jgi:toxin ParE1/3/4
LQSETLLAADRLVDRFDATLQLLASAPHLGRSVEELAPSLRSFPIGNYLIFYRPIESGIELIRVLHGAREITPEYFGDT